MELISAFFTAACMILWAVALYIVKLTRQKDCKSKYYPSLKDDLLLLQKAQIKLSVIIPAYNEEQRLPVVLHRTNEFLKASEEYKDSFEIIVVDDGSKDKTREKVMEIACKNEQVKLLVLEQNQGKGGAVKQGMLKGRGESLLFMDADGATDISSLLLLSQQQTDIVVGSRAHLVGTSAVRKRSFLRNLLMHAFHKFLKLVSVDNQINDTQCGFKLFKRAAAQQLFTRLHLRGWIFDIELLYLANVLKMTVTEVPVDWQEKSGSKLNVAKDSVKMALDVVIMKSMYYFGFWKSRAI